MACHRLKFRLLISIWRCTALKLSSWALIKNLSSNEGLSFPWRNKSSALLQKNRSEKMINFLGYNYGKSNVMASQE